MANESYSVYPQDIDGYATMPLRRDGVHEIVATDHNRLRDAIVKIEQELGIQPSGTFATVASRLDDIGDAKAQILAHMADPTDAHDASAVSILDTEDYYFGDDVEDALEELASLLPPMPDQVGEDNSKVPNTGVPSFYDGYGTKFVFNVSSADTIQKRTQPSTVPPGLRGIHIYEVGNGNDNGDGYLRMTGGVGTEQVEWMAPGDSSYGDPVDVDASVLTEGGSTVVASSDLTKRLRITRTSDPLGLTGGGELIENFEVYQADFTGGFYSLPSEGFKYSRFMTRTATSDTGTARLQCVISGMIFPADRGTLVLQRQLRGVDSFFPVAVLDLSAAFVEATRRESQKIYVPSMENFDTITLYDRLPVKGDYTDVGQNADRSPPYDNFENDFTRLQVAKFMVPLSNEDIVGGTLTSPEGTTETEADDNVSAFRLMHYKEGQTVFSGNTATTNLYSMPDVTPDPDKHDENTPIRLSNVYIDSSTNRPGVELANLRPVSDTPDTDGTTMRSGIKYYNSTSDLFEIEVRSDNNVFNKTYVTSRLLTFETDVFDFPNGVSDAYWGATVDIQEMVDDGYFKWNSANLPAHGDQAYYIVNDYTMINGVATQPERRIYPAPNMFSNHAHFTAIIRDPWGPGDGYDAYGAESIHRILVNSYAVDRATDTIEYFTDEYKRNDDTEQYVVPATSDGYFAGFNNNSDLPGISLQVGGRFGPLETDDPIYGPDAVDEFNIPGLIYPQTDYFRAHHRIRPTPYASGPHAALDYSIRTGHLQYQRAFTLGYPINSGSLRIVSDGNLPISFEEIRQGNLDRFGKIEIKIPGNGTNSTEWLDIGRLFETGQYEDGYGALHGVVTGTTGDFTVPFTFGTRNTSETNNYMAVRVTYFGETQGQRNVSKQKIMTMIQLLP